jgi:hypothetical protein
MTETAAVAHPGKDSLLIPLSISGIVTWSNFAIVLKPALKSTFYTPPEAKILSLYI